MWGRRKSKGDHKQLAAAAKRDARKSYSSLGLSAEEIAEVRRRVSEATGLPCVRDTASSSVLPAVPAPEGGAA